MISENIKIKEREPVSPILITIEDWKIASPGLWSASYGEESTVPSSLDKRRDNLG